MREDRKRLITAAEDLISKYPNCECNICRVLRRLHDAVKGEGIEMECRHEFFVRRLKEMELFDPDSDYDGMVGKWVEEMSYTFSCQRHSGSSAMMTMGVFNQLMDEWSRDLADRTNYEKAPQDQHEPGDPG